MKRVLLFVGVLLCILAAHGQAQSALVLDSATHMCHPNSVNVYGFDLQDFELPLGENLYWDFASAIQIPSGTQPSSSNSYFQSTNANFPNSLYYKDGFVYINPSYGFYADGYMRQTSGGFYEYAMNKDVTDRFGLGAMSGNNADSLIVPAQIISYSSPRTIVPYPCTMGTTWSNQYRQVSNCTITITGFGLNNVPMTIVNNWWIQDSIVAWGDATVPLVGNQSSKAYPVLVSRRMTVRQDSIYLAGQPAPDAFVAAFGGVQGGQSKLYRYWSFRADEPNYLFVFNYGSDSTFTHIPKFFVSDREDIASDVRDDLHNSGASVNPNPASSDLSLHFNKPNDAAWTVEVYTTLGERVNSQMISAGYGDVICPMSVSQLSNGAYMAVVRDEQQRIVSTTPFVVSH